MKKVSLRLLISLLGFGWLALSPSVVQASPVDATVVTNKSEYTTDEPINVAITLRNPSGEQIITSQGFSGKTPFHLFLCFTGPDGRGIFANDLVNTVIENVLLQTIDSVSVEAVEILPSTFIQTTTVPDVKAFYSLTEPGSYKIEACASIRTYSEIFQTLAEQDFARLDSITFAGPIDSNRATFTIVADTIFTEFCTDGAKPQVLTMRYTGENCSASDNTQDPSLTSCQGDPMNTSPVYIVAANRQDPTKKNAKVWFEGNVTLDSAFDISAANAGASRLGGNTFVSIFDDADQTTLLQRVQFHTSCSAPLNSGDQFGSLMLLDFVPE